MKNLFILALTLLSCLSLNAQFDQVFGRPSPNTGNVTDQQFVRESTAQVSTSMISSQSQVPSDIADITGRWYDKNNQSIVALQWNGQKWLGTVLEVSTSNQIQVGEIVIELFPIKKDRLSGRLKVIKNKRKSKWKEVEYKVKMTKLKGDYTLEFYGK